MQNIYTIVELSVLVIKHISDRLYYTIIKHLNCREYIQFIIHMVHYRN